MESLPNQPLNVGDVMAPTVQLTDRFEAALLYATRLHARQVRKGSGVPYISHLLSVTALVLEDGGDEDEAIAALLHDAIEDQGGAATREAIRQQFGDRVTQIVAGCTEADGVPKPPWQERKQAYLANLPLASAAVRRVSLADKLHNGRSILADWHRVGNVVWSRFRAGKQGTLWFYQSLVETYQKTNAGYMAVELERLVESLAQLPK